MTTSTTSTVLDQTSDAGFRTWVAEVITQLVSVCGVTQTTDTGQINTSTVTRAGTTNTAAGYVILKFNDTLQATVPVFIKLEFGSGSTATTSPQMWITIGAGSNGSGTLTGITTTRVAVGNGQLAASAVVSYTSRFVYNSTYGYLGMAWKQNSDATSGANGFKAGFVVFRSNDTSGNPNSDGVCVITNSSTATGQNNTQCMQCIGFAAGAAYPPTVANGTQFLGSNGANGFPFGLTTSTSGGNSYTVPVLYMTPIVAVSAFNTCPLMSEAAVGSSFSEAVVGSTALTFLSCGGMFGGASTGVFSATGLSFGMLWQ